MLNVNGMIVDVAVASPVEQGNVPLGRPKARLVSDNSLTC